MGPQTRVYLPYSSVIFRETKVYTEKNVAKQLQPTCFGSKHVKTMRTHTNNKRKNIQQATLPVLYAFVAKSAKLLTILTNAF